MLAREAGSICPDDAAAATKTRHTLGLTSVDLVASMG